MAPFLADRVFSNGRAYGTVNVCRRLSRMYCGQTVRDRAYKVATDQL